MENKILVLTDNKAGISEALVWRNADIIKKSKEKYMIHNIGNNRNRYILCIIEMHVTVLDLLHLVSQVRKYYNFPICIFETDIIERYPGENDRLKGKIDIIIQRSMSKKDVRPMSV